MSLILSFVFVCFCQKRRNHLPNTSFIPYVPVTLYFGHDGFPQENFHLPVLSQDAHNVAYWPYGYSWLWCRFQQEWYMGKHILLLCYLENSREMNTLTSWRKEGWGWLNNLGIRSPEGRLLGEEAVTPLCILSPKQARFEAHQGRHFIHEQPVTASQNVTDALQHAELLLQQSVGTRG